MSDEIAQILTIQFELDPLDTVHAYQLHYRDQLWRKPALVSVTVLLVLEAILLVIGLPGDWTGIAVVLLASALGGITVPRLMIRFRIPRAARKIHAQQKALQQPIDVAFEVNGLRSTSETGTTFTPWEHYRKLREDGNVMLFYQSDALFQFVPKRFLSGSQVDDVRRLFMAGQA
ncbi:YcxB family protein [Lichenifustis flavocetrariae]|uniref:YcxB family protein n=1 Tax=Lichenifustis flavocetrariae TaxID=2949735 RepID=A0AA41Z072_9HYPH|nr:YcxB family protein [Lichenifustis flavocetrariae]MCW6506912.1 YcxB family protein [Lichenifustis flavocetrariae]